MEIEDKTLVYNINFCRICQVHNLNLVNTSATTEDGETYMDLLNFIFGDIIWVKDHFVSLACTICLKKVKDIAEFKRLCLQTNCQRRADKAIYPNKEKSEPLKAKDDAGKEVNDKKQEVDLDTESEQSSQEESIKRIRPRMKSKDKDPATKINSSSTKCYRCDICGDEFQSMAILERHVYRHNGTRNYICTICGGTYITQGDLCTHSKLHSVELKYACDICQKRFKAIRNLSKHKSLVHMDPKDYKHLCTICGNKFATAKQLREHSKRHNQIKNYSCELCGKAFVAKGEMLRHVDTHSNLRPYKCDLCHAEYTRKGPLLVHKSKRHGIGNYTHGKAAKKMYKCSFCGKSIAFKDKFDRHVRTHTGEKPYQCRRCDAKFICKSYIKPHLQKAHDIDVNMRHDIDATSYYDVIKTPQLDNDAKSS